MQRLKKTKRKAIFREPCTEGRTSEKFLPEVGGIKEKITRWPLMETGAVQGLGRAPKS